MCPEFSGHIYNQTLCLWGLPSSNTNTSHEWMHICTNKKKTKKRTDKPVQIQWWKKTKWKGILCYTKIRKEKTKTNICFFVSFFVRKPSKKKRKIKARIGEMVVLITFFKILITMCFLFGFLFFKTYSNW